MGVASQSDVASAQTDYRPITLNVMGIRVEQPTRADGRAPWFQPPRLRTGVAAALTAVLVAFVYAEHTLIRE